MYDKPMFKIIDGIEKYKVVDLDTGAESFFDEKIDAYKMLAVIQCELGHNTRLEIRP